MDVQHMRRRKGGRMIDEDGAATDERTEEKRYGEGHNVKGQ